MNIAEFIAQNPGLMQEVLSTYHIHIDDIFLGRFILIKLMLDTSFNFIIIVEFFFHKQLQSWGAHNWGYLHFLVSDFPPNQRGSSMIVNL